MKNKYEIRDDEVVLFITRRDGTTIEALIDYDDFQSVINIRWAINKDYVQGRIDGKPILLHRYLLRPKTNEFVDHINHNKSDNRRGNLRITDNSENQQNRKGLAKNNTSGCRGVTWHKQKKKWCAQIILNKKNNFIGYFDSINDADHAVKKARSTLMPYSKDFIEENGVAYR